MLPKQNRLQKERDFQRVFKNSKPTGLSHFSFRIAKNNTRNLDIRFGFIISNKTDKRATRRNALKRQLREVARSLISELETGYDMVVVVRKDFSYPYSQEEIRKEFEEGLKRLCLFKNPKSK